MRLVLLAVLWIGMLGVQTAFAQSYGWNGPPCRNAAGVSYKACSAEPAVPLDQQPCYVSHIGSYAPSDVEQAMISLCQAAKAALADPPNRTLQELAAVNSAAVDLATSAQDDPNAVNAGMGYADAIHTVGEDMIKLGARVMAYGPHGSEDGNDPVSEILQDIIDNTSVLGGMG